MCGIAGLVLGPHAAPPTAGTPGSPASVLPAM